ncbi:UxaA family hydrolase [Clostridium ganghwense]|uniref:UxaA family hydrolase n=1 Tax=Clostridium ganghwense TaxID=312089 RepID=A0ABT4CP14_9CLOT|nr:UxaA family hydrolase [Clostridium ganghwense]MCY6369971.1 UxaA family hydrolase [Clostridium ganghwense]
MKKAIKKSNDDNVATALENIDLNEVVQIISEKNDKLGEIQAIESIPFGNKIALYDIKEGENISKYGHIIGKSIKAISKGRLVHVHNVKSNRVDIPEMAKKEIIKQMGIKVG